METNLKIRGYLQDLSVDRRAIAKWILKKLNETSWN